MFIRRITGHERPVGAGRVLVALLLYVQVAQARVQQPGIGRRAVLVQQLVDALRPVEIRKRDAHDAQRIVGQLAVGTRQALALARRAGLAIEQGAVEQRHEGLQAGLVLRLLELRPAVLVEALVVKSRTAGAAADDLLVGELGLGIALGGKQQLAAPELHFGDVAGLWVAAYDLVERRQRLVALPGSLVGTRQLVEHLVVARIGGIGLQQRRIKLDRLRAGQVELRHLVRHALEFA